MWVLQKLGAMCIQSGFKATCGLAYRHIQRHDVMQDSPTTYPPQWITAYTGSLVTSHRMLLLVFLCPYIFTNAKPNSSTADFLATGSLCGYIQMHTHMHSESGRYITYYNCLTRICTHCCTTANISPTHWHNTPYSHLNSAQWPWQYLPTHSRHKALWQEVICIFWAVRGKLGTDCVGLATNLKNDCQRFKISQGWFTGKHLNHSAANTPKRQEWTPHLSSHTCFTSPPIVYGWESTYSPNVSICCVVVLPDYLRGHPVRRAMHRLCRLVNNLHDQRRTLEITNHGKRSCW